MIYDLTQINDELDMLEIRLNILDPHVDYFVIGQSKQTFSGKEKPLHFNKWDLRWEPWQDKIISLEIPAFDEEVFVRTALQKNYLRRGIDNCKPDDIIYYGDVDEIWKPQTQEGKLRQLCYSYYLNNRSSEDWQGTNMFRYKNVRNLNDIRADHSVVLENGVWHFTNIGGYAALMNKLQSYDHQEVNIPWVIDNIKKRMDDNEDYLGRTHDWRGNPFKMWEDESELPQYLLDNKEKWKHLFK